MEPGTGITILGTAIAGAVGGAKVVEKLLGPTADYLGEGLREWTQRRVENVGRIFNNAANRLGDSIEQPGRVPPKLLKEILDAGSFCDDELAAEYYGGILASGRTENGRDDRAATYVTLISQLSTYQIRFHFIFYTVLRQKFMGADLRPTFGEDLGKMIVYLPLSLLNSAMDFSNDELQWDILLHCFTGLYRQQLIEAAFAGRASHLNEVGRKDLGPQWHDVEEDGFVMAPTMHGIDFYLWAMGVRRSRASEFLDPDLQLANVPEITIPDSAKIVFEEVS